MNQTIKLDTRKREGKYGEARIAPLRRGERNNALLTVKICANGQPYDLAGKTASLVATTAAGKLVGPCPMQVAEAGIARIMLPAALYSAVGAFSGYVEIREGETLVDTTDSSYVYHVSDYVPVEPNTTYFVTMSRTTNTSAPAVCEYDSGKAFVAGHNRLAKGAAFTTASNAAFVRVSCKTDEPGVIQLEKGSIQTAYEPYTGGKPSPSPEWPQEIKLVESPTIQVRGRNLWPFASSYTSIEGHQNEFVKDGMPFAILPGAYTFSAVGSLGNTDAPLFGYTATGKRFQLFRIMRNVTNPKYSFIVTEPIASIYFVSNAADSNTGTISNIQLERNSTATEYKPHTSQMLTFSLPSEHPYLAKLPDGTADEIVVDEEGNVELVARVSKETIVASKIVDTWGKGYAIYSWPKDGRYSPNASSDGTAVICDKLKAETGSNIYRGLGIGISVGSTIASNKSCITTIALGDGADLSSIDGASFYYPLMTETRYPLGKIEMPKAQDSIVNAWTDAEVTPQTGIGYVRDVNIVVANLESAIASITEG